MRTIIGGLSFAILIVLPPSPALARLVEHWTYDRLFKEADLVVIAEATVVTDTDDKPTDERMQEHFIAQNTTFTIQRTLQGKTDQEQIKVLHYRLKPGIQIINGPGLVSFRTKWAEEMRTSDTKIQLGKPSFMLFLKKRKDGRFEPVSGQYDPMESVREMYFPLNLPEAKK